MDGIACLAAPHGLGNESVLLSFTIQVTVTRCGYLPSAVDQVAVGLPMGGWTNNPITFHPTTITKNAEATMRKALGFIGVYRISGRPGQRESWSYRSNSSCRAFLLAVGGILDFVQGDFRTSA